MVASPAPNESASPKERVLKIIEMIVKIGFPNPGNIDALKAHIRDLLALAPHLNHSDALAIKHMEKALHKIEHQLDEEGTSSEKMYTLFNKPLIILKTSLRNAH